MKILSLNIRGIGVNSQKNSLKRLLANIRPTVLLLQETMMEGRKAEEMIKECIGESGMTSINTEGLSGGSLTGCSSAVKLIFVNRYCPILGMELEDSDTRKNLFILNCTGPFMIEKSYGKEWRN